MAENLYGEGIPGYLEESRRGGHLWLFLPISTSGEQIRRFARGLLTANKVDPIEVFPKQDKLTTGPGSLIRLPFGVHRRSGKHYGFCCPTGEPLAPTIRQQIERLSAPLTVPLAAFESYSRLVGEEPEMPQSSAAERPAKLTAAYADKDAPLSERLKAAITVRDFIEQYVPEVRLDEQGRGFCPLHDDRVRSFSVDDERNFLHCFAGCGGGSYNVPQKSDHRLSSKTELK